MDRRYELDRLRRSLAAIPPGQPAFQRERAVELVDELIALRARHEHLVAQLRQLLDQDDT